MDVSNGWTDILFLTNFEFFERPGQVVQFCGKKPYEKSHTGPVTRNYEARTTTPRPSVKLVTKADEPRLE